MPPLLAVYEDIISSANFSTVKKINRILWKPKFVARVTMAWPKLS
jgi:hypothetical protein